MLEFKSTRFRGIAALACVGLLALATGVVACASSNGGDSGLSPDRISDVHVDQDAEATIVMLEGLEHPVFTAFAQQDPERIVVAGGSGGAYLGLMAMLTREEDQGSHRIKEDVDQCGSIEAKFTQPIFQ